MQQLLTDRLSPEMSRQNSYTLKDIFQKEDTRRVFIERNEESSIFLLPQILINSLSEIYIFKNSEQIKRFLLKNNDLIIVLFSALEYIRRIFGEVPIYLELHQDPEEDWEELFIIIKSTCSPREAVELENKLYEEWFVKIMDKVAGRLNFTEEPL